MRPILGQVTVVDDTPRIRRILIVDPDETSWSDLRASLTRRGLEVETCPDYRTARQQIIERPPDLLVAEIRLGEFNGLQLAMIGLSILPTMRAIVMSPFEDSVLAGEAARLGASYVLKESVRSAIDHLAAQDGD